MHPAGTSASLIQMEPDKHAHTVAPQTHLHGGHHIHDVVFVRFCSTPSYILRESESTLSSEHIIILKEKVVESVDLEVRLDETKTQ